MSQDFDAWTLLGDHDLEGTLVRALERHGGTVTSLRDAEEVARVALPVVPPLLFADPDRIGQAAEACARFHKTGPLLVAVVPAEHELDATVRAIVEGADDAVVPGHVTFPARLAALRQRAQERASHHRRQSELIARLRLADRRATLGSLALTLAHEITQQVATGLLDMDRLEGELLGSQLELDALSHARELLGDASESLRWITETARLIARYAGDLTVHEQWTADPNAVVEDALRVGGTFLVHRARVLRALTGSLPRVAVDPARLMQIVVDVLVTSGQSIPDGTPARHEIRIRTGLVGEQVAIDVIDTGPGLEPALIDTDGAVLPSSDVGLSLWAARATLGEIGGRLEISSGRSGSRFRILLPQATTEAPTNGIATLLVIDDNLALARSIEGSFPDLDVTVAHSGQAGRSALASGRKWDVVVCDLMLPDVGGADLYRLVLGIDQALASRFVFVTGGVLTREAAEFVAEIECPILLKPFPLAEMRRVVLERAASARVGVAR